MAQKRDYYQVLGVDRGASAEDIKKAYRKLAHEHHPDKTGGDGQRFKEVNEAYQVLGNDRKRKEYDMYGQVFDEGGRLFANLTLNDAKITRNSASAASVGKYLPDLPRKMYSFGGDLRAGRFTFGTLGRYVGKRYINDDNTDIINGVYSSRDPYFTAEAKAACALLETLSLSVSVQNIFDKKYYDYYRAPGRSWFAELTWKL